MNPSPIGDLQSRLLAEFERDSRGPRVAQTLGTYAAHQSDWRRFALFESSSYTRNLVARNQHFEMLVICWSPGQSSPIHNHDGQNCWMAVLEGEIEELHFSHRANGRGPLQRGASRSFRPGKVGFINDEIALHLIRPLAGQGGVSLHIYSKPIETCSVYDEATGEVIRKRLAYHSVEGAVLRS